jgi:hypothetical protein
MNQQHINQTFDQTFDQTYFIANINNLEQLFEYIDKLNGNQIPIKLVFDFDWGDDSIYLKLFTQPNLIHKLIESGASIYSNLVHYKWIHLICKYGTHEQLQQVKGESFSEKNELYGYPINIALENQRPIQMIKLIVDNVSTLDVDEYIPSYCLDTFCYGYIYGTPEIFQLLIESKKLTLEWNHEYLKKLQNFSHIKINYQTAETLICADKQFIKLLDPYHLKHPVLIEPEPEPEPEPEMDNDYNQNQIHNGRKFCEYLKSGLYFELEQLILNSTSKIFRLNELTMYELFKHDQIIIKLISLGVKLCDKYEKEIYKWSHLICMWSTTQVLAHAISVLGPLILFDFDNDSDCPIHIALKRNQPIPMINLILKHMGPLNIINKQLESPIDLFFTHYNRKSNLSDPIEFDKLTQLIISKSSDLTLTTRKPSGTTLFASVCEYGNISQISIFVDELINRGIQVEPGNDFEKIEKILKLKILYDEELCKKFIKLDFKFIKYIGNRTFSIYKLIYDIIVEKEYPMDPLMFKTIQMYRSTISRLMLTNKQAKIIPAPIFEILNKN